MTVILAGDPKADDYSGFFRKADCLGGSTFQKPVIDQRDRAMLEFLQARKCVGRFV